MLILISIVHVVVCLFLILVVLLQQGKGADLSVFGGGGTQAAFGARGATTLLHKLTVVAFVAFIVTTMVIGLIKTSQRTESVITDIPAAADAAPATEEAAEEVDATTNAMAGEEAAAAETTGDAAGAEDAAASDGDGTPENEQ